MSAFPDLRRRLGQGQILASLASSGAGFAMTTAFPALEVAAPMQTFGGAVLCGLMVLLGRNPFRRYDRPMRRLIYRLAAGNAVVACVYPVAVDRLTLGTVAAVAVLGYLSVGAKKIWRARSTTWGLWHIGGRLLVVGGIVSMNWPLQNEWLGLLCALAAAAGVWNTVTSLEQMERRGHEDEGAAFANLLSAPLVFVAVILLRGGIGWMSWDLVSTAGVAGLLTLVLPVLLTNAGLRRLSKLDVGVVQALTSPVHAMVALIGTASGWLSSDQRLTLFPGWTAILLIVVAAGKIASLEETSDSEPLVGTTSSGSRDRR